MTQPCCNCPSDDQPAWDCTCDCHEWPATTVGYSARPERLARGGNSLEDIIRREIEQCGIAMLSDSAEQVALAQLRRHWLKQILAAWRSQTG